MLRAAERSVAARSKLARLTCCDEACQPWNDSSVQVQRRALIEALWDRNQSVAALARHFGVSRKTIYKWKRRHAAGGLSALVDRSRARHQQAHTTVALVDLVVSTRLTYRHWGPKKLRRFLIDKKHCRNAPAERTIARILDSRGLLRKRRRRALPGPSFPARSLVIPKRPHDVWTVDFKGPFFTANGHRCEPLTVRDLFSRMVLAIDFLPNAQFRSVQAAFVRLFRRYGLPATIRVDNGRTFASSAPYGCSALSLWWMRLGIRVDFIRPASPQENGSHEQFHRVYKNEALCPPASSLRAQRLRSRRWMHYYNFVRPHEALGQIPPASLFRKSPRPYRALKKSFPYPSSWQTYRVGHKGYIRWRGRVRLLSRILARHRVALRPLSASSVEVYLDKILLGTLHLNDPAGMRPALFLKKSVTLLMA